MNDHLAKLISPNHRFITLAKRIKVRPNCMNPTLDHKEKEEPLF